MKKERKKNNLRICLTIKHVVGNFIYNMFYKLPTIYMYIL